MISFFVCLKLQFFFLLCASIYIYKISALWILLIRLLDFVRIWLIILLFWMFLNWVKECLFYYISGTHWFASLIWKLICRLGCTGIGVGAAYYGVGYVFFFLLKNITWIVNWIIGLLIGLLDFVKAWLVALLFWNLLPTMVLVIFHK